MVDITIYHMEASLNVHHHVIQTSDLLHDSVKTPKTSFIEDDSLGGGIHEMDLSHMPPSSGNDISNYMDVNMTCTDVRVTKNVVLIYLLTPTLPKQSEAANVSSKATTRLTQQLPANLFASGIHSLLIRIAEFFHNSAL